jgi:hypothetical protein
VTLFHHHSGIESQYVTHFHTRQGDRSVGLAWDLRDKRPREVAVFRSTQDFVEDGVDPTGDDRQRLVYQGSELHARLSDDSLTNDIAYYYSVFAKGDDGNWHLQLTDTVAPKSESHWRREGYTDDGESLQRIVDMDIDSEAGYY